MLTERFLNESLMTKDLEVILNAYAVAVATSWMFSRACVGPQKDGKETSASTV